MKVIIIVFVSVIGLVGFTINGFAQDVGAVAKQQADLGMTVSPKSLSYLKQQETRWMLQA